MFGCGSVHVFSSAAGESLSDSDHEYSRIALGIITLFFPVIFGFILGLSATQFLVSGPLGSIGVGSLLWHGPQAGPVIV